MSEVTQHIERQDCMNEICSDNDVEETNSPRLQQLRVAGEKV